MINPINKTSLYNNIVNQLIKLIKKGVWKPEYPILSEKELANQFEVSRNSVREALKTLQFMGILESHPGKGTFLTKESYLIIEKTELIQLLSNNTGETLDLLEVRMAIEIQSADLAAKLATPTEIEILKQKLDKLKNKILNGEDSSLEGFDFHLCIAHISKNKYILKFFQTITKELLAQRNPDFQRTLNLEHSLKDHANIYRAISENNSAKARTAMYKHFIHAIEDIKLNKYTS